MKVLCLGNNTELTDEQTISESASQNEISYGLLHDGNISTAELLLLNDGFYHTSIYDIPSAKIKKILPHFDRIIVLNQPAELWVSTHDWALTNDVAKSGNIPVIYRERRASLYDSKYWNDLVTKNKSFCIHPFIQVSGTSQQAELSLCCYSNTNIASIVNFDFKTNTSYNTIRNNLLSGIKNQTHCNYCYKLEESGLDSPRQKETVLLAQRLGTLNTNELLQYKNPIYYSVTIGNKCNLMCRMCDPSSSHLIEREYLQIGMLHNKIAYRKALSLNDVILDDALHTVYIMGGEPLIANELFVFLNKCIQKKTTDFNLIINTNATVIPNKLKKIITHFTNLTFTVSIDGYDLINYYIRYPSNWNDVINNLHYMQSINKLQTITTVISIYNISKLYDLYYFLDTHFPNTTVNASVVISNNNILSPYIFPDKDIVIKNLLKTLKLNICKNNKSLFQLLTQILAHYTNLTPFYRPDISEFFYFNDKLDRSRSIRLIDYIPELAHFNINV